MFSKLLIANRGEIACRVIRASRKLEIPTVAVYSDADESALHVRMADEAVPIGRAPAAESYLSIENVLAAAHQTNAEAVHPGYGFLSENRSFAEELKESGIAFIGPPAAAIEAMGDKITSKKIAAEADVPTVPGHIGLIESEDQAVEIARLIGFPVMIKASAGGGGKGMRIAWRDEEVVEGFWSSKREASSSFGDDRIFIEKFIESPRHIEIQVLADGHGNCIHLNERECSIQRRHQKVIEEAPSPFLDGPTRQSMGEKAVALARAVDYSSAGTVEFIVDKDRNFYFLEMNTRLQVEHPITELITGVDLVEQMIRVAAGERLALKQDDIVVNGWAIESRIYAEDPYRRFLPSIGRLVRYRPPAERANSSDAVRNDTGVDEGGEISVHYDPMIAKLCTWGTSREKATGTMREALDTFEIEGISCNIPFLSAVMDNPRFKSGELSTAFIDQEFPDGFAGVILPHRALRVIAASTAVMTRFSEVRRSRSTGRMSNHERRVGDDWKVVLDGCAYSVHVSADREGSTVKFDDGEELRITSDWVPGKSLAKLYVNGELLVLKVGYITGGFRISYRGAELRVLVRTPRQAELGELMAVKKPPDTTKQLLCPMPGLITSIHVSEGERVEHGQALCTVEAMKMENILRAERSARVKSVTASPGQTLAVDEMILEFE